MKDLNPTFKFESDFRSICKGIINTTGISAISYSRIHSDGSRSELWTDSNALIKNFIDQDFVSSTYTPDFYRVNEGFFYLPAKILRYEKNINKKYEGLLNSLRSYHGLSHPFKYVVKNDNIIDYMIFYTPDLPGFSVNNHINNIELYVNFYREFLLKSSKIITDITKSPIIIPNNEKNAINKTYIKDEFGFDVLSPQEMRLVFDIILGIPMGDNRIGVSKYTAESYMKNIKSKLNVTKKEHIISKYYEWKYSNHHANKYS